MGVSTDGEISYGILFDEDFEFPWDDERYDDDIDNWWLAVNGFKPPFELYDEDGEYIGGVEPSKEKINAYYESMREFQKAQPLLPVELVNVCSYEYPIYILAVPGTVRTANRGFPKAFNPAELIVTDEQRNALVEFCRTHHIDTGNSEPGWYLSSLWG